MIWKILSGNRCRLLGKFLTHHTALFDRDALLQRCLPVVHGYGGSRSDIYLGLQRPLQQIPHLISGPRCWLLFHGKFYIILSAFLLLRILETFAFSVLFWYPSNKTVIGCSARFSCSSSLARLTILVPCPATCVWPLWEMWPLEASGSMLWLACLCHTWTTELFWFVIVQSYSS